MEKELLNVDEAAELLNIRPTTVRAWILKRRVPFVKFGRSQRSRVFLRRCDLEKLIEQSLVPAKRGERP